MFLKMSFDVHFRFFCHIWRFAAPDPHEEDVREESLREDSISD
jgi:hypothetical protein